MGIVKEIRFNGFEDFYHAMGPSGKLHSELRGFVFRECPAYTLLYQFSPKDTGQSKVK